jgi:hypothetical protein
MNYNPERQSYLQFIYLELFEFTLEDMKMINLRDEITAWQPLGEFHAARSSVSSTRIQYLSLTVVA